jgi:uncharacterized protein with PQ loop repeat
MTSCPTNSGKLAPVFRALIEIAFIIFLFYANLLMGEFTRSSRQGKSLAFAIYDEFTFTNLVIAIFCGMVGYLVVEYLRKKV